MSQTDARFRTQGARLVEHRFAAISGRTVGYDAPPVHVDLTPRSNGDKTITIDIAIREDVPNSLPIVAHVPPFTVVENRKTDHEADSLRLHCLATTDPKFFPYLDAQSAQTTFIEGTYVTAARAVFVSHTYTFEDGKFTDTFFSDAGGGSSSEGSFEVDGERIILQFHGHRQSDFVLKHLILDGVHVLMDIDERPIATGHPDGSGCYVRLPAELRNDPDWWNKLLTAHPRFAKALPGGGK
jgi:hypothetical protein